MAFPDTLLAAASTWFSNVLVDAARIQANITDNLNTLATRVTGIGQGFIGDAVNIASTVTLTATSTTPNVAGLGPVTFTLATQRRVKITVQARYLLATATGGRMVIWAGYNTGASPVIGSITTVGGLGSVFNNSGVTGANGSGSAETFGTVLLAAGTYTAYPGLARVNGGSATDTAGAFYTLVEDVGSV